MRSSSRHPFLGSARRCREYAADLGYVTRYKRVSGDAVEYEVFARKTRAEPLHQVGSVVAPDDDLAMAYARATYDEERWCEMAIVRKENVIELWQPGEP
jgi:1,2-phenylacetyl-CoA epoxidase PaaB subunit